MLSGHVRLHCLTNSNFSGPGKNFVARFSYCSDKNGVACGRSRAVWLKGVGVLAETIQSGRQPILWF